MRKYICAIVAVVLAVLPVCAQERLSLGGCVVGSDADDYQTGMYQINHDGRLAPLTLAPEAWATGGGVMVDGVYYCTCLEEIWEGFYYATGFAFDGETWEQMEAYDLGTDLSFVATDMTYDATTGRIYGCFYDGTFSGYEFGTMAYGVDESRRETIARLDVGLQAIAAAPDGTLYAIDFEGRLVTVNKSNGQITVVGGTGLISSRRSSATIDPTTGEMYVAMGGHLHQIDTQTGAATLVCSFAGGKEMTGLFTFDATVLEKPKEATEMTTNFGRNSLTGTVSFTAPTQTIAGGALKSELTYKITATRQSNNDAPSPVGEGWGGVATPGATVNAAVTLPEAGLYNIEVSLGNEAGTSRTVSTSVYVGDDVPTAVQNVSLSSTDGLMMLSWEAPAGVHGGYIDMEKVTYRVVRIIGSDETTVATDLTATTFSERISIPTERTTIRYSVTATYLGVESETAQSNAVMVGQSDITLPYTEDFEADGILDLFTVIDANGDGLTWRIYDFDADSDLGSAGSRAVRIDCNEQLAMDDWLITAPIRFEGGKSYSISCIVTTYNSPYFPERLEIRVAAAPTVEAMQAGAQVMRPTELKNLDSATIGGNFRPATDGTYYIGLHGMSDADMFFIIIDRLTIEEGAFDAGPDVPEPVQDIRAEEIAEGRVRITWTAPMEDINGRPLDTSLTYKIIDSNYRTVAEGLDSTEFTYDAVDKGEQDFLFYYVGAENSVGMGEFGKSEMITVGTPYDYPYEETFAGGETTGIFGVETPEGSYAEWELYTESTAGIADADGTNGFIGMYGYYVGECSSLFTGKISLAGAEHPVLSFYYNALTADNRNTMEVAIREAGAQEWTVLSDFVMEGATHDYEWIRMSLPLDGYRGKTVQLRWTPTYVTYNYGLIDGIRVGEVIERDLAVKSIAAPTRVIADKEFEVSVVVANEGQATAEDYTVVLWRDGEQVQEMTGNAFVGGTRKTFVFVETLGVTTETAAYSAEVILAGDENEANNYTREPAVVTVKMPAYPTVTDLAAAEESSRVRLTWSAPNLEHLSLATVTEDFEDATALSQAVAGWAFVDGDEAVIGGIQGVTLPFRQAAWFVIDGTSPDFGRSFASHSGDKHMATMFNYNGEQNDDWMISPELCGEAQTISLWAKSYIADYGLEHMEILYSDTDREISSFVSVGEVAVAADWTEFTFDLPEGARFFAIRCTSQDVYMLFVDDVTYVPAGAVQQTYTIVGYNVYRDGVRVNDAPLADATYLDTTTAGEHTYVVTVVYEQGESAPSNAVTIDAPDAIVHIAQSGVTVSTASGAIVIESSKTVTAAVYSAEGRLVTTTPCVARRTTIPVTPGMYIVCAAGAMVKVVVR